ATTRCRLMGKSCHPISAAQCDIEGRADFVRPSGYGGRTTCESGDGASSGTNEKPQSKIAGASPWWSSQGEVSRCCKPHAQCSRQMNSKVKSQKYLGGFMTKRKAPARSDQG